MPGLIRLCNQYGLIQAAHRWNKTFHAYLVSIGFTQHHQDPCLYYMIRGKDFIMLGNYVDDLIKVTNCTKLREQVDKLLEARFKITHQGVLAEFIGLQCAWRERDGQRYFEVHQSKYLDKILSRFGMSNCNSVSTPALARGKPHEVYMYPNTNPAAECDPEVLTEYRSLVGAVLYASLLTRLDIAYAVGACAQFMSNPSLQHLTAAYRILRYLKGTKHYSLKYYKSSSGLLTMYAYCDSNFMGDHDCRSVGGYIFVTSCGILSWSSKRLSTISTSTAHAETQAFFNCVKECVHLRQVISDLPANNGVLAKPTPIWGDSSACLALVSKESGIQAKSKHWKLYWSWLHEQRCNLQTFTAHKVDGADNISDMCTKPMPEPLLRKFVSMLRLCDPGEFGQ